MKPTFLKWTALVFVLAFVFQLTMAPRAANAAPVCDPVFVTLSGAVITVSPTGADDTANLQCAFDSAVASGLGTHLQLVSGTFHTAQIVVSGFHGRFSGAGMGQTRLVNLPDLEVTPVDFNFNPPSAANPWPALFAFIDGNFLISDLAIQIVGVEPTTGWSIFGIDPPLRELSSAIVILGTDTHAEISQVMVKGEVTPLTPGKFFEYNLINGIFYEGFIGETPAPISGSLSVHDSTFQTQDSAIPLYNLSQASVNISRNDFEGNFSATLISDLVNSSFEFSHNSVNGKLGIDFYNSTIPEDTGSSILVKNNNFRVEMVGVALEQTLGEGNQCLILGNNVEQTAGLGIYLGPGIHGCTVVGGSSRMLALDLGSDNLLTGVNNMGTGVGPSISGLLKRVR